MFRLLLRSLLGFCLGRCLVRWSLRHGSNVIFLFALEAESLFFPRCKSLLTRPSICCYPFQCQNVSMLKPSWLKNPRSVLFLYRLCIWFNSVILRVGQLYGLWFFLTVGFLTGLFMSFMAWQNISNYKAMLRVVYTITFEQCFSKEVD